MEEISLSELQIALNQLIYADIYRYIKNMPDTINDEQAFHLILGALSTNMGILLAQSTDANRENYAKICKDIIDKSCKTHIKISDHAVYGHVGHA